MKDLFYNVENFMFRTPTEPEGVLHFTEKEVREACLDPCFREKVKIASPSMIEIMDLYLNCPKQLSEKKKEGLKTSVMRYYARSKMRTTPFGLFAGVGLGSFEDGECFERKEAVYEKKVNADAQWLYGYLAKIERQHSKNLWFQMNGACYQKGGRAFLLYSTEKEVEEVSVRKTRVFEIIAEVCREMQSYGEIIHALRREYRETEAGVIKAYIAELIEKEILISSLRPPLGSRNQMAYAAKQCEKAGLIEEARQLWRVEQLCRNYEKTEIGKGMEAQRELEDAMKKIYTAPHYIQVDTLISGAKAALPRETEAKIRRLAGLFVRLDGGRKYKRTYLEEYFDKFIEKYGYKREVPVLELLDTGTGLGAPAGYLNPRNDFYEPMAGGEELEPGLKRFLLAKYERAVKEGTPILLREEELERWLVKEPQPEEIPLSMELYFIVREKEGALQLYLGPNCGSFGAGKTFGRFSVLSEEWETELFELEKQEEKQLGDGIKRCEVSFLPAEIRSGNITRSRSKREWQLTLYTNPSGGKERCLHLEDVVIGAEGEWFYAKDRVTNKKILFEANNMYNILLQPNVLRFLQEIGEGKARGWAEFPWKTAYAGCRHVPEIRLEDIVVSNEKWVFTRSDLHMERQDVETFTKQFLRFAETEKLPEKVYLADADNRIPIDLSAELSLRIIYEELKKGVEKELVLERMEEGEAVAWDGNCRYATEIVVPLFGKLKFGQETGSAAQPFVERQFHMVYPFEDWLYLKLYGRRDREEELITFHLAEFCRQMKEQYQADSFFMRYADPKPHIRLRFHAPQEILYRMLPDLMEWCNTLLREEVLGDVQMVPYEREVERYGGEELIAAAERVFFADSRVAEEVLLARRLGTMELELEEAAVMSVLFYVRGFYEHNAEQMDFLERNFHAAIYEKEWKERKQKLVKCLDIETDWKNFSVTRDGKWLYALFAERNREVEHYRQAMAEASVDEGRKNDIVASVLHLHCNRLLGTDRELEKKVMALAESVLYAKKFALGEREKYGTGKNKVS